MRSEFSEIIGRDAEVINEMLLNHRLLKKTDGSPAETVIDAEVYALSAGGKRIRPVLAVEFYKLFSCIADPPEYVWEAACALEMVHTFSLIHDDMPEMDDDDLRRGKPSTHIKYGCAAGLLAGDGLAILPFELIAQNRADADKASVRLRRKPRHDCRTDARPLVRGQRGN